MKITKINVLKICVAFILFASVLCGLYFLFATRCVESYDIAKWNEIQKEHGFLPTADEMGDYTEIGFKHFHRDMTFLFSSDAYTLRATYEKAAFEEKRVAFEEKYLFQEDPIHDYQNETVAAPAFTYSGFDFRVLDLDEYDLDYPKKIVFVGFSEKTSEIAFVYFYDFDLDRIESFEEFLANDCGFE